MHLNDDAVNMLVAACSGGAATDLAGDAAALAAAQAAALPNGAVRLSDVGCRNSQGCGGPNQGRIEVFKDGLWGTVCGHWFWDSNEGADIVCKQITDPDGSHPYAGGTVYTFGEGADEDTPIHTGCTVCHNDDTDILQCELTGVPGSDDGPGWGDGTGACPAEHCHHRHDQGAICFRSSDFVQWGEIAPTVQPCADSNIEDNANMALIFSCIQYASVQCSFDVSGGGGSYAAALAAFTACEGQAQPGGYCSASISSAEYLSNQHVCQGASATQIGFRKSPLRTFLLAPT